MADYPSLKLATEPQSPEDWAALAEAEAVRAWIAQTHGLEALAITDQFVRAMAELGVTGSKQTAIVSSHIDAALVGFQLRGFGKGQAPSPDELKASIQRIADHADGIEKELGFILTARRGAEPANSNRSKSLRDIHHAILRSIAANALPPKLTSKFSGDDVDAVMPEASLLSFNDPWVGGFAHVATRARQLIAAIENSELANPRRRTDQSFIDFVHRLGAIYQNVTYSPPRADDRKETQPEDWHSPFVRFFREVWPLTPEGLNRIEPPSDARLRRALEAPPSF